MTAPEVRINYAWMLDNVSEVLAKSKADTMVDYDLAVHEVDKYRELWDEHSRGILDAMCEALGLRFYGNVIDVSIGQFFMPQSEPLVIGLQDSPDIFIDTLTHELIHKLLLDNHIFQAAGKDREVMIGLRWQRLFGENHSFNTVVHIPVHATHEYIFTKYFKDMSRRQRDIAAVSKFNSPDYSLSWQYVLEHGYESILEKLKLDYLGISQKGTK